MISAGSSSPVPPSSGVTVRKRAAVLALLVAVCASLCAVVSGSLPSQAAPAPAHTVTVQTAGATMFPGFSPGIGRYAVRPTASTAGTLTVRATTSDPAGSVRVNGRTAVNGAATVTGLEAGEEIAVFIDDAGGTAAYSLIYLPADFPLLERTTPMDVPTEDGLVLLTLGKWIEFSRFFEIAVDNNGVPAVLRAQANAMDFKLQPNGHFSTAVGAAGGSEIVEYDAQWNVVDRHQTTNLFSTDGHDSILLPDGSAYLMAYEPNAETGLTDAVIQHVAADGSVFFEWNSKDHVDIAAERVVGSTNKDYAHINSFEIMDDGDILASFRHFSSIFKIARHPHDDFAEGDVVWKLGGKASDFTFTDTAGLPDGGPCAQHTAGQLPNGNIVAYDNGSWNLDNLCVDPADPTGPTTARVPTRIAEWSLDEATGEATMVRDVQIGGRYAIFAGSAQPLPGGNTMIGWASATQAVATEVDGDGSAVWELVAPESPKYFTYRAFREVVPDATAPTVSVEVPDAGVVYDVGDVVGDWFECTDSGGSSLVKCDVTRPDTSSSGSGTMTVRARDGAGNETVVSRNYTVVAPPVVPNPTETPAPTAGPVPVPPMTTPTIPAPSAEIVRQPDLHVKSVGTASWRGRDVYDAARKQLLRRAATKRSAVKVRIENDGTSATRFRLRVRTQGTLSAPGWADRPRLTPLLAPGESWTFRVVARQTASSARTSVSVVARDQADAEALDRVTVRTRWR